MDIQVDKESVSLTVGQDKVTLHCTDQAESTKLAHFLASNGYTDCIVEIQSTVLPYQDQEPEFV